MYNEQKNNHINKIKSLTLSSIWVEAHLDPYHTILPNIVEGLLFYRLSLLNILND